MADHVDILNLGDEASETVGEQADNRVCSVQGCDGPSHAKGMCSHHYYEFRKNISPKCIIDLCDKPGMSKSGLCLAHARRKRIYGDPLGGRNMKGEANIYFEKALSGALPKECMFWPYTKISSGYGQIVVNGQVIYVHRFALMTFSGQPDPGPDVECRHLCGNGHLGCFNPLHLKFGTAKENGEDTVAHGRSTRGEKNPRAKLKTEDVLFIRKSPQSAEELAINFNVTPDNIRAILGRRSWAWLEG